MFKTKFTSSNVSFSPGILENVQVIKVEDTYGMSDDRTSASCWYQYLVNDLAVNATWDDEAGNMVEVVEGLENVPETVSAPRNTSKITTFADFCKVHVPYVGPEDWYPSLSVDGVPVKHIVGEIDCSSATSLQAMFQNCAELEDVPNILNTSKVTDMGRVFCRCNSLTSIPTFDTGNATNMSYMFFGCYKLAAIPNMDTNNVVDMNCMFSYCESLTTIPNLDTSNVVNMHDMFRSCKTLTAIPNLNTSKVTNMWSMFSDCASLTTIPNLDTSKVTTTTGMFMGSRKLTTIPTLDMREVTVTTNMFQYCSALTDITLKNIKTNLQVGSGSSYGHNLTVNSLVNLIYECRDTGSVKTLTIGTTNINKLKTVYVKAIDITNEMRAKDDLIDEKLPFVVCDSTDEGAMLITNYVTLKNWKLA